MTTVSSLSSASISSALKTAQARLQRPITQLQNQAAVDQAQISAWGTIKGSVSSLAGALSNIADVGTVNTRVATSTASAVATATAAASATTGTYTLSGITLARPQEVYSAVKSSAGVSLGSGTGSLVFTLNSGKTETVSFGSGAHSLTSVAAAINAVAGGVRASVIGTSAGARLVLQGSASGSANGFSFAGGGALAGLKFSPGSGGSFTEPQAARSATLAINGVPVTSASNTLGSAVSGVTFNLLGTGSAVVKIASSAGSISNNLAAVATSLSGAIAAIAKQTKYVSAASASAAAASGTTAKSGPLLGNFTATDLANTLTSAVSGAAASGLSANAIGFGVGTSGAITFNAGTFATAYAANPNGVSALVSKLYADLNGVTTAALGSGGGTGGGSATSGTGTGRQTGQIAAQTAALQSQVTALGTQETQIQKDNSAALEILVQQYTAAESIASNAQISQAYLSVFTTPSNSSG
ncbi:MAG: hypothetical protein B7Z80_20255 [Rhodospirillales bacterium 20-64-7]|nr:MAG: hypothetical protein B7Z80_20255 [Rhodospirillales bacterium 20-64-7]